MTMLVIFALSTIHVKGNKRVAAIEEKVGMTGSTVAKMVSDVLMYYVNDDAVSAEAIVQVAMSVSDVTGEIREMAIDAMKSDPELVTASTDYLVVAGYLRTSDYVTDIAGGLSTSVQVRLLN